MRHLSRSLLLAFIFAGLSSLAGCQSSPQLKRDCNSSDPALASNRTAKARVGDSELRGAAEIYEHFATTLTDRGAAAEALFKAGLLYEKLDELRKAAEIYKRYATTFTDRDDAPTAFFKAGLLYEKLGKTVEQRRVYLSFLRTYKSREGHDWRVLDATLRLARLAKSINEESTSQRLLTDVVDEFNRRGLQPKSRSADVAAEASILMQEPALERFENIRIEGTIQELQASIKRKLQELRTLIDAYNSTIRTYKSMTWSVCSVYRQGRLWMDLIKKLQALPKPKGLSAEEVQLFQELMDTQIARFEEVAMRYFKRAVEVSRELKVVHPCETDALKAGAWIIWSSRKTSTDRPF